MSEQQEYIMKLKHQIKMLQNRCYVLSDGKLCIFCPYDCDRRTKLFQGDDKEEET